VTLSLLTYEAGGEGEGASGQSLEAAAACVLVRRRIRRRKTTGVEDWQKASWLGGETQMFFAGLWVWNSQGYEEGCPGESPVSSGKAKRNKPLILGSQEGDGYATTMEGCLNEPYKKKNSPGGQRPSVRSPSFIRSNSVTGERPSWLCSATPN